jgi:hypothetical protein
VTLYTAFLALGVALAALAIWSRTLWPRLAAVLLLLGFVVLGPVALASLTGEPRRASLEWWARNAQDVEVLGFQVQEDVAIYVYVVLPGYLAPQSLALPYSDEAAEQLQQAAAEGEQTGRGIRMRRLMDTSLDEQEPLFYADPPQALPEKQVTAPAPVEVR